jgi:hypothetical protein
MRSPTRSKPCRAADDERAQIGANFIRAIPHFV